MRKINITIFLIVLFVILNSSFLILNCPGQWVMQNSGVTYPLRDIEFINISTGWVCGGEGTILKTTNGGINWIYQYNEAFGKPLLGIHPVNESVVYCVGWFQTILKTTNGGTNWITLENGVIGQGDSYYSVFFRNEQTGWIGSGGTKVKKTTNGGLNWNDFYINLKLEDIYFKDSLNGIGVSEGPFFGKTSDGGLNWTTKQLGSYGEFYRISFLNANSNIGFIVSGLGKNVYKTTNFGISFDTVGKILGITSSMYCSEFSSETIGWTGGTYGQLYKTDNGGFIWRVQNSLTDGFIRSIFALNDTVVWACGGGGKIIYTSNGGDTITNIFQISTEIPDKFSLEQNYPNPFNSSTIIKFQCYSAGNIKLKVYNLLGIDVAVLVNNYLRPGTYKVRFNSDNISSGIYFYRLESERNSKIRKLIIIK